MNFDRLSIQRFLLVTIFTLISLALYQIVKLANQLHVLTRSQQVVALFGLTIFAISLVLIAIAVLFIATWTPWRRFVSNLFEASFNLLARLKYLNLIIWGLAIALFSFLMIGPFGRYLGSPLLRWSGYLMLVLAGIVLVKASGAHLNWYECLLTSLLVSAAGYRIAAFIPNITNYPFSLGWSEGSRYYYASLFLSEELYGFRIPPSVLHPTRYLMQSVPFLIPDTTIWVHRVWQIFLWFATTLITAGLLTKRLNIEERFKRWMFVLWISLFLILAPVYYHLQIPVILILWGFNKQKPWQTTIVVLLASVWAGISRINWFPVPGMLAATLYFLEQGVSSQDGRRQSIVGYLTKPVLWVGLGTLVAFGSQSAYAILSGNPVEQFGSSFTSELLWYRLFPSATYPLGVLTGALLLFFPILLYISLRLRAQRGDYHPLRVLGIAAILLVLFVGGLIVSVKIGGGSNLHNLDAFIVLFLVVSSYVYFDRIAKEVIPAVHSTPSDKPSWSLALILGIVILIPVLLTVDTKADSRLPEDKLVYNSIKTIQENINEAAEENGDVLFLSERQLLMFDTVGGVPMVPEYEKVFLMEMAMANNPNYLDEFYENLRSHRYALIVSEPLKIITQDRTHSFGEENNAWVERVAKPLLCYYEPIETLKRVRTQLLIPRTEPTDCP